MKTSIIAISLLITVATARSLGAQPQRRGIHRSFGKREVPQEHSHEAILTAVGASLNLNNPDKISDPVFGLLGAAAAIKGAGDIKDADCLQQATADQAFGNAKAAKDIAGMTAALIYRTLERNTGAVGLKSVPCTSIKAVNPEIAALSQHQDPASAGAAAENKAIALELAVQIAAIGGDPADALKSGTFAPGVIGDPTGKGKTCDNLDDPKGCIFTQGLLVEDASAAEIAAAVAAGPGAAAGAAAGAGAGAGADAAAAAAAAAAAGENAGAGAGAGADAAAAATAAAAAGENAGAGAGAGADAAAGENAGAGAGAGAGADAAAAGANAAGDTEELLSEVAIDATTSIKIIKVTKAGADGAAAADAAAAAAAAAAADAAAGADGAAAGAIDIAVGGAANATDSAGASKAQKKKKGKKQSKLVN